MESMWNPVCTGPDQITKRVQVFRTYNASVTLDRLLWSNEDGTPGNGIAVDGTVDAKKASYDRANKEARGDNEPSSSQPLRRMHYSFCIVLLPLTLSAVYAACTLILSLANHRWPSCATIRSRWARVTRAPWRSCRIR